MIGDDFDGLEGSKEDCVVFVRLLSIEDGRTFILDRPGLDDKIVLVLD